MKMEHRGERRETGAYLDNPARDIEPGDHVAVIFRETSELAEVTEMIRERCGKKRWSLLYIARFMEKNPAVERGQAMPGQEGCTWILSHDDPDFHRNFATADRAYAYIRKKVEEAVKNGYSALCIMREVPPLSTRRSDQNLVSDLAELESLFQKGNIILICAYSLADSPPTVLQNVLRTHPLVVLDKKILENFFFIPASDAKRYNLPSLELQHWLDTLREISRRTEALRENEARYRDLLENASDLIQSVDAEGRFLFVNRTWRETLGYTHEDLRNMTLFDVIDPVSLDHCRELFQRVTSGEDVGRFEAVFRAKSGKKVYLEGRSNCLILGGRPRYTRGIFRDITNKRTG
ncbi:MAG TPA: PAS domain S-box protein [Methanolinea sp.]|nr:PAS domain S-box protein [Methanolinea sp.]